MKKGTHVNILSKARNLISNPIFWTQEVFARDKFGVEVHPLDDDATCWCALGALIKFTKKEDRFITQNYLRDAAIELDFDFIDILNDNSGHSLVLKMYDKAIEFAEKDFELGLSE